MRFINMTRRNGKRVLGALLMAMAVGAVAPAAQADAAYEIKAQHSGKCLDVPFGTQEDGWRIQQYTCNGQYNQQFSFEYTDSGYYMIRARHSGKCLDVHTGHYPWGADVIQYTCWGGYNQQFERRYVGSGLYEFVARHSRMCFDIEAWAQHDTARLQQWGCNGGANQLAARTISEGPASRGAFRRSDRCAHAPPAKRRRLRGAPPPGQPAAAGGAWPRRQPNLNTNIPQIIGVLRTPREPEGVTGR
jgi:hypothetical protein